MKDSSNLDVKGFLADVLADVGSDKAQELIVESFTDTNSEEKFRNRVMFSTLFVKTPNKKFRTAVVNSFKESAANSELKGLSLRSIGAIAHKYKDSDEALSNQMLEHIIKYKKEAFSLDQKLSVIDALGNSHMTKAAKELEEYLDTGQSELVRAAAVRTLAKSESDYALNLVSKKLSSTSSAAIVEDALRSFWTKNWSKHSKEARYKTLEVLEKLKTRYSKENKQLGNAISEIYERAKSAK